MRTNPEWERLREVGEGWVNYLSRSKTYTDLRGGLLAIHEVGPGRFGTTYFSARSIRKSHRKRRDGTLLIRAVGAALVGLFVFLLLMVLIEAVVSDETLKNTLFTASAIAVLFAVAVYSLTNIFRFVFSRPTTRLIFGSRDAEQRLEFWHIPGRSTKLDWIVESIGNTREHAGEPHSVSIEHDWSYIYPLKNAILLTLSLFLLIGLLGNTFDRLIERYALELFYFVWLGIPPVAGAMFYFRARHRLTRHHGASRTAIERLVLGDYHGAEASLREILESNPEDGDALELLVHLHLETDDFGKAKRTLDFLQATDDDTRFEAAKDIDLVRSWRAHSTGES